MPPTNVRVRSAQSAAGEAGQDRLFLLPHAVIVLDGTSGETPSDDVSSAERVRRDGGAFAERLGTVLAAALREEPLAELGGVLAAAISDVAKDFDPATSPESTVAIARWDDEKVDALVLGDSRVVGIHLNGTLGELCDRRIHAVATELRERYQARLRERHGFDEAHLGLIAELRAAERRVRNRPGGYPIAATDPGAAAQALTATWPIAALGGVGLATDGAWRGRHLYQEIPPWPMLLKRIEFLAPKALIVAVQEAETNDPDGRQWPRPVRHDDKTLAVVSLR
jgi:hypothetical protein